MRDGTVVVGPDVAVRVFAGEEEASGELGEVCAFAGEEVADELAEGFGGEGSGAGREGGEDF